MSITIERKTILIVDDESFVADVQKLILEGKGYLCRVASDYDKAIEISGEMSPDVVLLDLSMEGKNGIDILQELQRMGISNVFIVSGVNDPKMVEKCIKMGAKGYLMKPFKAKELIKMIEKTGNRSVDQSANRSPDSSMADSTS
jgi:two-component system chemotaxis response regulator CheY